MSELRPLTTLEGIRQDEGLTGLTVADGLQLQRLAYCEAYDAVGAAIAEAFTAVRGLKIYASSPSATHKRGQGAVLVGGTEDLVGVRGIIGPHVAIGSAATRAVLFNLIGLRPTATQEMDVTPAQVFSRIIMRGNLRRPRCFLVVGAPQGDELTSLLEDRSAIFQAMGWQQPNEEIRPGVAYAMASDKRTAQAIVQFVRANVSPPMLTLSGMHYKTGFYKLRQPPGRSQQFREAPQGGRRNRKS